MFYSPNIFHHQGLVRHLKERNSQTIEEFFPPQFSFSARPGEEEKKLQMVSPSHISASESHLEDMNRLSGGTEILNLS